MSEVQTRRTETTTCTQSTKCLYLHRFGPQGCTYKFICLPCSPSFLGWRLVPARRKNVFCKPIQTHNALQLYAIVSKSLAYTRISPLWCVLSTIYKWQCWEITVQGCNILAAIHLYAILWISGLRICERGRCVECFFWRSLCRFHNKCDVQSNL